MLFITCNAFDLVFFINKNNVRFVIFCFAWFEFTLMKLVMPCAPELEAQGITNFINVKSNVLETLKFYLKEMGI